ncbi:Protein of unknown function [Celeribacter neptunius]|uniref:DUF982 domain-containing protein n=1 Tax=Celeribacter neptunius TaxID=588602 RepID=A0A1I3UFN3_9RHOB|nr:Protein of unknown function [Celeribacter neptunius]
MPLAACHELPETAIPSPRPRGLYPRKKKILIEIYWGTPLSLVTSPEGDVQKFGTIEKARHWLHRKWPVSDDARQRALETIEAAMDCMTPVGEARKAFMMAAKTAGFVPVVATQTVA